MDLRGSRAWVRVGASGWVSVRPHARPPAAGPCCALSAKETRHFGAAKRLLLRAWEGGEGAREWSGGMGGCWRWSLG